MPEHAPSRRRSGSSRPGTPEPRRGAAGDRAASLRRRSCAAAFVAVYALDRLPHADAAARPLARPRPARIAAALIVTGKRLVVTEELEDEYPPEEHPEEQEEIVQTVAESGSRLTRRRLFTLGLGTAGGALGGRAARAARLARARSSTSTRFYRTPWRRGRRLVDEDGRPYRAADIEQDTFYTAFPEGADREQLASPLVVVRLPPRDLDLPRELAGYAAAGIVAYSKICTHAGLRDLALPDAALPPTEPKPALVCPCHYSTFDPATGGDRDLRARRAASCRCCRSAIDRRGPPACSRQLRRARRPVLVGCSCTEADRVIRQARPLPRPAHRRRPRSCRRRCATCSPTTGRSCSARSRSTASSSSSPRARTWRSSTTDSTADVVYHGPYVPLAGAAHDATRTARCSTSPLASRPGC